MALGKKRSFLIQEGSMKVETETLEHPSRAPKERALRALSGCQDGHHKVRLVTYDCHPSTTIKREKRPYTESANFSGRAMAVVLTDTPGNISKVIERDCSAESKTPRLGNIVTQRTCGIAGGRHCPAARNAEKFKEILESALKDEVAKQEAS